MKNLILGIIDNYKFSDINNFLISLKNINYNGHICLYAGPNISFITRVKIKALGIEVINYKKKFPYISLPHPENFNTLPKYIHIYNYRHFLYYDYLLKNEKKFKNILITDVKDVVFQKDPFSFNIEDKIYVAVENTSIPIGKCDWTSNWIREGYSDDMLERLKDKEVLCAGTTLAPNKLMLSYLKRLIEEFFEVKDADRCADQAMHNVLIHLGKITPIFKSYNFEGPLLTVGTEPKYHLDKDENLIDTAGKAIPTIHQYDRHNELKQLFKRKYESPTLFEFIRSIRK